MIMKKVKKFFSKVWEHYVEACKLTNNFSTWR